MQDLIDSGNLEEAQIDDRKVDSIWKPLFERRQQLGKSVATARLLRGVWAQGDGGSRCWRGHLNQDAAAGTAIGTDFSAGDRVQMRDEDYENWNDGTFVKYKGGQFVEGGRFVVEFELSGDRFSWKQVKRAEPVVPGMRVTVRVRFEGNSKAPYTKFLNLGLEGIVIRVHDEGHVAIRFNDGSSQVVLPANFKNLIVLPVAPGMLVTVKQDFLGNDEDSTRVFLKRGLKGHVYEVSKRSINIIFDGEIPQWVRREDICKLDLASGGGSFSVGEKVQCRVTPGRKVAVSAFVSCWMNGTAREDDTGEDEVLVKIDNSDIIPLHWEYVRLAPGARAEAAPPPPPTTEEPEVWACSQCTYKNADQDTECAMCRAPSADERMRMHKARYARKQVARDESRASLVSSLFCYSGAGGRRGAGAVPLDGLAARVAKSKKTAL